VLPLSSVIFGCPNRSEFQDEKNQWHADQHEPSEGRKTIQKSQKGRLPLKARQQVLSSALTARPPAMCGRATFAIYSIGKVTKALPSPTL